MSDRETGQTPTPWQFNTAEGRLPIIRRHTMPHGEADTFSASIVNGNREHVCRLDFGYGKKADQANAELILNAVNAYAQHQALIASLRGVITEGRERSRRLLRQADGQGSTQYGHRLSAEAEGMDRVIDRIDVLLTPDDQETPR